MLQSLFRNAAARPDSRAEQSAEPTLAWPVSQACTANQFFEPAYAHWCRAIHEEPRLHRKQWEFCFILQALAAEGKIAPGRRGLGFGVGGEPLPAVLVLGGARVTASDQSFESAHEQGWTATNQHAADLERLNDRGICPPRLFEAGVEFRTVDMNAISADLVGYDFCWSACALEHLGSIRHGLEFIERSLDTLKPGGVAVHTTELNCSSDGDTLDNDGTVLFRRSDFEALARRVGSRAEVRPLNFNLGSAPADVHIDVPPYSSDNHLKLKIEQYVTTSFGIILKKHA